MKSQISVKSHIAYLEARTTRQTNYIQDLKRRCEKAISALADLAAGYGRKKSSDGVTVSHTTAMQNLAAEELAVIAKMPLREVI